jgi:hypothetical protein
VLFTSSKAVADSARENEVMINSRSNIGVTLVMLALSCISWVSCRDTSWRAYGHDTTQFSRQPNESVLNASSVATLHVLWDFAVPGG